MREGHSDSADKVPTGALTKQIAYVRLRLNIERNNFHTLNCFYLNNQINLIVIDRWNEPLYLKNANFITFKKCIQDKKKIFAKIITKYYYKHELELIRLYKLGFFIKIWTLVFILIILILWPLLYRLINYND